MPLHPQAQTAIEAEQRAGAPPLSTLTAEQARARARAVPRAVPAPGLVVRVEDREIPGPDGNRIPVRLYWPSEGTPLPLLVWFHGGGWVTGDLDGNDAVCHMLAHEAGAIVMSVDYRLAPEHPFPAPAEDCSMATNWAANHAVELGARPGFLAVGGASAGANLAAAVTLMARDRSGPSLVHQLLVYPVTDCNFDTDSYSRNGEGFGLSRDSMRWYWEQYLGPGLAEAGNPYAAPMQAPTVGGLPRAHVITAEYDPLCDEGEEYARRLEEEGALTVATRYPGMVHGFFTRVAVYDDAAKAIAEAGNQMRISVAAAALK
jgi:acetyl esterase